jgi:hypothetical protein
VTPDRVLAESPLDEPGNFERILAGLPKKRGANYLVVHG